MVEREPVYVSAKLELAIERNNAVADKMTFILEILPRASVVSVLMYMQKRYQFKMVVSTKGCVCCVFMM